MALLETEVAISTKEDFDLKRAAQANRRSALSVARHLIGRYDKTFRADSGIGKSNFSLKICLIGVKEDQLNILLMVIF